MRRKPAAHSASWRPTQNGNLQALAKVAYFRKFAQLRCRLSPRAGRSRATMAALELSVDVDWMRWRAFGFYQSGDDDLSDGTAGGFCRGQGYLAITSPIFSAV